MSPSRGINIRADRTGETRVRDICAAYGDRADALLEILTDVQEEFRRVSDDATRAIADALNLSRAEVHGARTFYSEYSIAAKGSCLIRICRAEACQAVGAESLAKSLSEKYRLEIGETSADGSVMLESVYCLGNCALGPAVMVGKKLLGRVDLARVVSEVDEVSSG